METNQQCPPDKTVVEGETHFLSQSIIVMMALMGINSIALSYIRKARSNYPFITKYIQDATVTTLIGIMAGIYLSLTEQNNILATIGNGYQEFFMIILLPPILFESAINMDKKTFFRNIGSILMYALVGTFIASLITAIGLFIFGAIGLINRFTFGQSFAFGALISATDPVTVLAIFKEMNADKNLNSLIFGESILNDAISISLYRTMAEISTDSYEGSWLSSVWSFILLFLGSMGLGFLIGLLCAIILKKYFGNTQAGQENTETTTMILIPWISYLIGEAFNLSGIVTILFCGIAMTKYALPNLSKSGRILTKKLYQALSSTSEHIVFIFIGIGFFSFNHQWEKLKWFIFIVSFIIITMSRFAQISMVTSIVNKFRSRRKITRDDKMVMTYSGFRGAMAFALAANATKAFPQNDAGSMMLTLTLVYATLTIFLFGSSLVPILEYYGVLDHRKKGSDSLDNSSLEIIRPNFCWDKVKATFEMGDDLLIKFLVRSTNKRGQDKETSIIHDNHKSSSSRLGKSHEDQSRNQIADTPQLELEGDDPETAVKHQDDDSHTEV